MKPLKNCLFLGFFALLLLSPPVFSAATFLSLGTGGTTGVFYPVGGAICRVINKAADEHNVKCRVQATGGSIYNLNALKAGELDLAIVQEDQLYDAYVGQGAFEALGPNADLRVVLPLYQEAATFVARADTGISSVDELEGKRVNIGNPGSGHRAVMERFMAEKGWEKSDFKLAAELKSAEQAQALCDNKVDAIFFTVGHPSGSIQEITTTCDSHILSLSDADILMMTTEYPYYTPATIAGGLYKGNPDPAQTFGNRAVLVSTTNVAESTVNAAVQEVLNNLDYFLKLHPVLENMDSTALLNYEGDIPVHAGVHSER